MSDRSCYTGRKDENKIFHMKFVFADNLFRLPLFWTTFGTGQIILVWDPDPEPDKVRHDR